jgi:hypothetical protein
MTSLTIFQEKLKSNGEAALVIAQDLVSVPSVLPDNRSVTGNEIRLAQLFKEGAIQPNDRFHFSRSIKTYIDGDSSDITVGAQVVIRAQEKSSKAISH